MFDSDHLPPVLAGILLVLIGVSYAVSLGGHLRDVVLVASLSTMIGTLVAYRAQRRGSSLEPLTIIARYQGAGLAVGVLAVHRRRPITSRVNRTLPVFLVLVPVAAAVSVAGEVLGLSDGVVVGLLVASIMLVALLDPRGFLRYAAAAVAVTRRAVYHRCTSIPTARPGRGECAFR